MKHIKTFESQLNDKFPKIGNYVILNPDELGMETKQFIGQIVDIEYIPNVIYYKVYYDDLDTDHRVDDNGVKYNCFFEIAKTKESLDTYFIAFSPDKEEMEMIIQANKYNI